MLRIFVALLIGLAFASAFCDEKQDAAAKTNAKVYAVCDDSFEMYVNDAKVLSAEKKEELGEASITLNKGDFIEVRCNNFGKSYGFACVILFNDPSMKPLASSTKEWKSYKPKDLTEWYSRTGMMKKLFAKAGSNKTWKNHVTGKTNVQCESIWGDPKESTAFIFYEMK